MSSLIDLTNDEVRAKLDAARAAGTMTYEQLNELLPAGDIDPADVEDTIAMLADMGIEVSDGTTEEERDQAVADAMDRWIARTGLMPQITGDAWAALARVSARKDAAWPSKLKVPQGFDIPEPPIPEDNGELQKECAAFQQEMSALLEIRTSPDCPDGQEGAALDSRYIYVMNRTFKLQCELRRRGLEWRPAGRRK